MLLNNKKYRRISFNIDCIDFHITRIILQYSYRHRLTSAFYEDYFKKSCVTGILLLMCTTQFCPLD